ncbi:hypothetical protein RSAG8_03223, partial [Rhizoctonia solani AG-8 WAC10335]
MYSMDTLVCSRVQSLITFAALQMLNISRPIPFTALNTNKVTNRLPLARFTLRTNPLNSSGVPPTPGECATSDIVAGVNYVVTRAASTGRPTIATMSLGGPTDTAIDSAVSSAISRGIHFTVAAGNENQNAGNVSPARVSTANTIGAVDSSNRKASFSNYGSVLDVWALGVNVRSSWIGSNSAVNTISGTSMATPQVAGALAVVIGNQGNSSPAALSSALKSNAQAVVTGAPSGTTKLKARVW